MPRECDFMRNAATRRFDNDALGPAVVRHSQTVPTLSSRAPGSCVGTNPMTNQSAVVARAGWSPQSGVSTHCVQNRARQCLSRLEHPKQPRDWIVELVDDALLHWDDRIVGNADVLGADFRATLSNVAVSDAVALLEIAHAILGIQRVHLKRRVVHDEAGADEFIVLVMVAQDMADILAEETLDALSELLHSIDIHLEHRPRTICIVGLSRLERLDLLLDAEVPTDIGHQIPDGRERLDRLNSHFGIGWQRVHARHAHEARLPVDLR